MIRSWIAKQLKEKTHDMTAEIIKENYFQYIHSGVRQIVFLTVQKQSVLLFDIANRHLS